MGLPSMDIRFIEAGVTAIKRGARGVVVLILEDSVPQDNPVEIIMTSDIPSGFNAFNKDQIEKALIGYQTPPKKVIAYTVAKGTEAAPVDYSEAQNYLETIRWDYLAIPEIKTTNVSAISTWIKALRDTKKRKVKAVLPNSASDHEGIINFTTKEIWVGEKKYVTSEYCGRIAGLIAGTPMTISCTFAPLPEVTNCDKKTDDEISAAIDKGELVLYNDGEKVKVARGVNSFVTTTEGKQASFKKIKIVEAMDMIHDDIKKTAEDSYLGKYSNSYDNKCLLIVAIKAYLERLEMDGILNRGKTELGIDIEAQRNYLLGKAHKTNDGRLADSMTDQEVKEADTEDKIFLGGKLKVLDAIEDIVLPITI